MHQKIIDYQRHTVEFSSITPTRTTPPLNQQDHPKATRPTLPHQPQPRKTRRIRISQQNQPKPCHHPEKQRPDQPYQINPECQIQEFTREITIRKTIQSFPAPSNKGTRRSLNTHQTTVKSCHQQSHNRTISTPTSPHPPGARPRSNTATTTPPTQIGLIQDSNRPTVRPRHGCVWWVNTTVRGPPQTR